MDVDQKTLENLLEIPGQTTFQGLGVMQSFLSEQRAGPCDIGDFVEFGTFKGRVSVLLGLNINAGADLFLVDPANHLDEAELVRRKIKYKFFKKKSEDWTAQNYDSSVSFVHSDASHYFNNVLQELRWANHCLRDYGVMVLDDFNDPFNQVRGLLRSSRKSNWKQSDRIWQSSADKF